jgi:hypothetical protein
VLGKCFQVTFYHIKCDRLTLLSRAQLNVIFNLLGTPDAEDLALIQSPVPARGLLSRKVTG